MTDLQRLRIRGSEIRSRLLELGRNSEPSDDDRAEIDRLTTEYQDVERRSRALEIAGDGVKEKTEDAEGRELRQLQGRVRIGNYLRAASEMRAAQGAELEYNQALEMGASSFPLRLLAPRLETRATTDAESQANQGRWLDRLFAVSAAARVGVTFESVAAGVASFPVTTAGASGDQQDRQEATADAAWTVGVTECKPKRGSVRAVFSVEDAARLPGLEEALRRDLSMALMEHVDATIFKGDADPSTAAYDITGLQTAANVVEKTITQANKVKGEEWVKLFCELVDGKHASMPGDLGIVASVGSNTLWASNYVRSGNNVDTLISELLKRTGHSWVVRGDIDTASANGDFGGYVGRMRGIEGAAVAAVWENGELIRDPYGGAAKGETALTLAYLWDFQLPRPTNFARVKYVA